MSTEQKRKLTTPEIRKILSFIKPNQHIPAEVANKIAKNIIKKMKKQLQEVVIYPSLIPELRKEMEHQYHNTQIQSGEAVGVLAAQSIGEKQTQSNLNTFHKAGSGDGRSQGSGLLELLNATKEPKNPGCLIYFNEGNNNITELRETIGSSLVQLTFDKIATDYDICINKEPEPWYEAFKIFEGDDFEQYTDCISLKIDMDILFTYKITLKDISEYLMSQNYSDIVVVYSPDCYAQIDIFVNTQEIELPAEQVAYITAENAKEIYLDDVVRPILSKIVFCGIAGVENMFFIRDDQKWGVEVENTREKLADSVNRYKYILAHPAIDMTRTISNNIWDIYHVLGIEAARQYMFELAESIMDGINMCHPLLLVDKMTHSGTIASVSRYSMRNDESGPFGKASFEETLDNFLKAGVYGQQEPTRGVSASIICGKMASVGTGMCELRMDMSHLGVINEDDEEENDNSEQEDNDIDSEDDDLSDIANELVVESDDEIEEFE